MKSSRSHEVVLVEPGINPITSRFGLPVVANYPPLAQVRLEGQIPPPVRIADLRIPGEKARLLAAIRQDPPALLGISVSFTSNGDEAIALASEARAASPDLVIDFGGTAPSEDPASFFDSAADLIGFRAGDGALAALVREIRKTGACPDRFPGFFHRESGRFVLDPGPEAAPLSDLLPGAWHLLP